MKRVFDIGDLCLVNTVSWLHKQPMTTAGFVNNPTLRRHDIVIVINEITLTDGELAWSYVLSPNGCGWLKSWRLL